MGNEWEMGNVLYIFIGFDLWLIFIFQGTKYWVNGGVPIPAFLIYSYTPTLGGSCRQ